MRTGLYPGTFDPVTMGHIDIVRRACSLVDRLVIGVAINRDKGPLFDLEGAPVRELVDRLRPRRWCDRHHPRQEPSDRVKTGQRDRTPEWRCDEVRACVCKGSTSRKTRSQIANGQPRRTGQSS